MSTDDSATAELQVCPSDAGPAVVGACAARPSKPPSAWWMNADQYDAIACPCILSTGHDGAHKCADDAHPRWPR